MAGVKRNANALFPCKNLPKYTILNASRMRKRLLGTAGLEYLHVHLRGRYVPRFSVSALLGFSPPSSAHGRRTKSTPTNIDAKERIFKVCLQTCLIIMEVFVFPAPKDFPAWSAEPPPPVEDAAFRIGLAPAKPVAPSWGLPNLLAAEYFFLCRMADA